MAQPSSPYASTARALAKVSFLRELSHEDLEMVARSAETRHYAKGDKIVAAGDVDRSLFVILKGRVEVRRGSDGNGSGVALARFGPGEFFGEMALLENRPRSADVVAIAETSCAILSWTVFRECLLQNPVVSEALLTTMSRRLRALSDLVEQPRVETSAPPRERERRILQAGETAMVSDIRNALVIKEHNHFTLFDPEGNIPPGNTAGLGMYLGDTRHLSGYQLSLGKVRSVVLVSTAQLGYGAEQQLTNRDLTQGRHTIRKETLLLSRERLAHAAGLHEVITVSNFNSFAVEVDLHLQFASDFADIFEVRGIGRARRGAHQRTELTESTATLGYAGEDGWRYQTTLAFSPRPTRLSGSSVLYRARVQELGRVEFHVVASASASPDATATPASLPAPAAANQLDRARKSYAEWLTVATGVTSDNEFLDATLSRSLADLRLLVNRLGEQWYFAAGIPWFATLFGRDSIITGLQTLAWNPELAAGILRLLAQFQGTRLDDWRDEEPGKILHELRTGELARMGQIPHTPYYGTIDATPLFLMLAVAYYDWTGDRALLLDLVPHLDAALEWCVKYGDLDGDDFVEYARRSSKGLANQGWKDSGEGIMFADGRLPEPPLALVEVQSYLYAAYTGLARVYRELELASPERIAGIEERAARLKKRFDAAFWMPETEFYALGLDGAKQRIDALTSNPGHALWGGIAMHERAGQVARRLVTEDFFSGWGVRTLARSSAAYNPLGYHLGTVWPHDNSLIVAGLCRYGFQAEADTIFQALFDAALAFPYYRLPELFCGIARTDYGVPIGYPVACSPQAWAAASIPFMLAELLGLRPEAGGTKLSIVAPRLPLKLRSVELRGLRVGNSRLDLRFTATSPSDPRAKVDLLSQTGEVAVHVVPGVAGP